MDVSEELSWCLERWSVDESKPYRSDVLILVTVVFVCDDGAAHSYDVREQLRTFVSLLVPLCALQGLNSGHQVCVTVNFAF